jgi:hypothetical protein
LAWFWVAAATAWLAAAGCFSPSFPQAQACAPENRCPGDLTCVEGLCCPTTAPCGVGDGDGGIDSTPDAEVQVFTDHEQEFVCDTDTELLLHFDDGAEPTDFDDACNAGIDVQVEVMGYTDVGKFGMGIDLNRGATTSEYTKAPVDALRTGEADYTVEAWLDQVQYPFGAAIHVIASGASFAGDMPMEARYVLGVNSDRKVQLDLFNGVDCDQLSDSLVSEREVSMLEPTHVRAVVTATTAQLFVNGFADTVDASIGTPCRELTGVEPRISGIRRLDNADLFENTKYRRFIGVIDELRISRGSRVEL